MRMCMQRYLTIEKSLFNSQSVLEQMLELKVLVCVTSVGIRNE